MYCLLLRLNSPEAPHVAGVDLLSQDKTSPSGCDNLSHPPAIESERQSSISNSLNADIMPKLTTVPRQSRQCNAGDPIYCAGSSGLAWRVTQGSIRLDSQNSTGEAVFASLALPGDILGSETMLFGAYAFSASALTRCEITPWPEGAPQTSGDSLLATLASAQRRAADLLAIRDGQAVDRVIGLIRILTGSTAAQQIPSVILPARKDIAEITALRLETVSRIIKSLERTGALRPTKSEGVHAARSFTLNFAPLAA